MYFHNALMVLKENPQFKEWEKENKDAFLSYAMFQLNPPVDWVFGFYVKHKKKFYSFFTDKNTIINMMEDVPQTEDAVINELDTSKIKVDVENILDSCTRVQKEFYSKELPAKTIIVLQNYGDLGSIYNVTVLTSSFKTLNIKLDPTSGKVISHDLVELFRFDK